MIFAHLHAIIVSAAVAHAAETTKGHTTQTISAATSRVITFYAEDVATNKPITTSTHLPSATVSPEAHALNVTELVSNTTASNGTAVGPANSTVDSTVAGNSTGEVSVNNSTSNPLGAGNTTHTSVEPLMNGAPRNIASGALTAGLVCAFMLF